MLPPPKRPTKAIKIVDPNSPQPASPPPPPPPPPPAPPLPSKGLPPTTSPRTSPGYELLKSIIENLDSSLLPTTQRTFRAHAAAQLKYKCKSSSKEPYSPPMEKPSESDKGKNTQTDPLLYTFTRIFLPHNRENTTCLDRFEALQAATTQQEWDLAYKWKVCAEMNAHTVKSLHAQHGPDAVVSLAMKRWLQRVLGLTLEEIFAPQIQHPLGLSAVYYGDPMAPPVYHYSEQQGYNMYTGFPHYEMYGSRNNVYHPQRTPQLPLRTSQPQSVPSHAPFVQPQDRNTLHHSASLPALPRSLPRAPNLDSKTFQHGPRKFPGISETRFPRRPLPRAPSPVPNPSGRNTPPHKRSPKKKKPSCMAKVERAERAINPQGGKNVVPRLVVDKWAKGRGVSDNGGDSSTVLQQSITNSSVQSSTKRKGKERAAASQMSNGEVSSTSATDASSSKSIAKTLQNKKHVVVETITVTSTATDSSGWDLENDIDELIANATANGNNRVAENDQASVEAEGSWAATNQFPDEQSPYLNSVGKPFGVAKILMEEWTKGKQQVDKGCKDQILDNEEGSSSDLPQVGAEGKLTAYGITPEGRSWLINDPLGKGNVSGSSSATGFKLDYFGPAVSGSSGNVDLKSSVPVELLEGPAPARYRNMRQPPRHKRFPRMLDSTMGVGENTDTPRILIPIKGPAPVCPFMFPPSLLDYAETTTDVKNVDEPAPNYTPPTSQIWKPSKISVAPTKATTGLIKLVASPPAALLTPTRNPALPGSTSPNAGKFWSSIVTGNAEGPSVTTKGPQNTVTTEGFPELAKPLSTLPSNQPPIAEAGLKKKTSLSATAKPFEPAALKHTASMDSYLRTVNYAELPVLQHPVPIMQQFSMPIPPATIMSTSQAPAGYMDEYMNFPFDCLLEIFYNTPQFTHYLDQSYNELLFMENYLRAQYQRISTVFEDEWDYITVLQRKAIVAKALSNLSDRVDKVQFNEGKGVESMLRDLGLVNQLLDIPPVPVLRRATNPDLKEAYIQGASATGKEKEKEESARSTGVAYLKWRAEYCFDLDPDALSITPNWLFGIIGWLLGVPHPLRHRFGPRRYNKRSDSSVASDQVTEGALAEPEFWCPDGCLECAESEQTGWSTEWTFFKGSAGPARRERHSSSGQSSPMLERFLDEMETPEGYFPEAANPQTSTHSSSFVFSRPSTLKVPRLMSNRFTDPIFHLQNRSEEWKANNPGRVKFMEILNIDMALFYCALIKEILEIFGEVRGERVWFRLPKRVDYYDELSWFSSTQSERGRTSMRAEGQGSSLIRPMSVTGYKEMLEHYSRIRSMTVTDYEEMLEHISRRAEVRKCVTEEQERVRAFVEETQRSLDWLVGGLKLVDRDSDTEIGRACDGGLWEVPVPPGEREALEKLAWKA